MFPQSLFRASWRYGVGDGRVWVWRWEGSGGSADDSAEGVEGEMAVSGEWAGYS